MAEPERTEAATVTFDVRFSFHALDPALGNVKTLFAAVAEAMPCVIPSTMDERDEGACLIEMVLPDRLVVAGEHEQEVRADQTRRIVEWLESDECGTTCAHLTAIEIDRKFGGGDDET